MQEGRAAVRGLIKIEEHLLFKCHRTWDAHGRSSADVHEYMSQVVCQMFKRLLGRTMCLREACWQTVSLEAGTAV